jgi:hypothetical protein
MFYGALALVAALVIGRAVDRWYGLYFHAILNPWAFLIG